MRSSVLGTALPFPYVLLALTYGGLCGSPYSTWRRVRTPALTRGPWRHQVRSQTFPPSFSVAPGSVCSLEKIKWSGAVLCCGKGVMRSSHLPRASPGLKSAVAFRPRSNLEPRHLWSGGNLRISTPCHGLLALTQSCFSRPSFKPHCNGKLGRQLVGAERGRLPARWVRPCVLAAFSPASRSHTPRMPSQPGLRGPNRTIVTLTTAVSHGASPGS